MIKAFSKKRNEILGINRRNQQYIRPLNPRSSKKISDNKLVTKRILKKVDIPTPELFKVVRTPRQLELVDWPSLPKSMVVKPNRGSIGSGIIVFYGRRKSSLDWIKSNGDSLGVNEIKLHMQKILEGRFSMGNRRDVVIIEERIKTDKLLSKYSYKGVPDIRLILFNKVPVMAMMRLPTKRSEGKANLHAGGICVGVDIASGVTTTAMHLRKRPLVEDTYESLENTVDLEHNRPLRGVQVPHWEEILEMSIKSQEVCGLGYMGVDIVIDRDKDPMILELNARPGLGIQSANVAGLRPRLERIDGLNVKGVKHGMRLARNIFGGEVEESIESVSGKTVVNLVEKVALYHVGVKKVKKEYVNALLDTGILTSRIDRGFASRVGYSKSLKEFNKYDIPKKFESFSDARQFIKDNSDKYIPTNDVQRMAIIVEEGDIKIKPVIEIAVRIAGNKKVVEAVVSKQSDMIYPILIGRRELKEFLIDAGKTFTK